MKVINPEVTPSLSLVAVSECVPGNLYEFITSPEWDIGRAEAANKVEPRKLRLCVELENGNIHLVSIVTGKSCNVHRKKDPDYGVSHYRLRNDFVLVPIEEK